MEETNLKPEKKIEDFTPYELFQFKRDGYVSIWEDENKDPNQEYEEMMDRQLFDFETPEPEGICREG